jgi:hypothetical protein
MDYSFHGNGTVEDADPTRTMALGFRFGDRGTHTSRTIMIEELSLLFDACPANASRDAYRAAILERNCLGKRTTSNRKLSGQRLTEMYGLDPAILIFRVMRQLWERDEPRRSLLALLTALARDPLLRSTAGPIIDMKPGTELSRQRLAQAVTEGTGTRLNEAIVDKVVRNTASSWTQSGHLRGRAHKTRSMVSPTPFVTAYAILLGYLLGARGQGLFSTLWARSLDSSSDHLIGLATDAKVLGLLDVTYAGGVVDISPIRLLTEEERRLIHGTD